MAVFTAKASGVPEGQYVLEFSNWEQSVHAEYGDRVKWEFTVIASEGEDVPYSPASQTGGGGRHLFFLLNGKPITNRAKLGGYPIDCRGTGGYVLLPPSNHVSGHRYTWLKSLDDCEAEDAPAWLTAFVTRGASPATGTGTGTGCDAMGTRRS